MLRVGPAPRARKGAAPRLRQETPSTRCDLHLHSSASKSDAEWYGRYFDCPESYVDPLAQYELCKARGMDLVTLTDHDTLDGGLQLIDKPGFFLSEEITATFPDNGCVLHVLAWNITPDQHGAIQERRDDIYRLTDYLQDSGIAYGLAHPLLSPNWKLDRETFEALLLLFPTFETVNGLTDARIERDLLEMMASLDQDVMARLAAKHQRRPHGARPHVKAETAGSDDHVNRRNGTVYTELKGANLSPELFLKGILAGEGRVVGHGADLNTMAACAQRTASEFLRRRDGGTPLVGGDPVSDLMEATFGGRPSKKSLSFLAPLVARAATKAAQGTPESATTPLQVSELDRSDAAMVEGIAHAFDAATATAFDSLADALSGLDFYRIIDGLRDLVAASAAAGPYLLSANHFGKQYAQVSNLRRDWTASQLPERRRRLAVFSDSLEEVDGVSTWCERFTTEAKAAGCDVLVPFCGDRERHPDGQRFHPLPAVRTLQLPFYTQMKIYVPSLVGTIDWMWRHGVSNVELSTPGPMGLIGLLAAKILRLPVTATYHTEIPGLVSVLG